MNSLEKYALDLLEHHVCVAENAVQIVAIRNERMFSEAPDKVAWLGDEVRKAKDELKDMRLLVIALKENQHRT